ncbi:hypothetical protein ES319_A05G363500v1 [Gossypium barbadense]|uniref:Uncharacterized protein n=2 Tax=Gossypium TaxID=3633 RepID=A0A5J5VXG2_GOSBA|nr:hypothetical protein ES319_A05G363500v1 [Gossypium barbadense]TYH19842.1 hypothetical protein ES288_A05G384000v1 [Gossypium darwinii]
MIEFLILSFESVIKFLSKKNKTMTREMRKSFKDSLRALKVDIHFANTL